MISPRVTPGIPKIPKIPSFSHPPKTAALAYARARKTTLFQKPI